MSQSRIVVASKTSMPTKRIMNARSFIASRLAVFSRPAAQSAIVLSKYRLVYLYAANCVHSSCFVLLLCLSVCVFVYLLQLIYFFLVCLCVHLSIYDNFDILSYFSAWPSHAARLALPISEWLCSLSFHNNFLLMS